MKAHLQRHFDAGRTVIGVEAAGQPFGRHRDQALGQLDHRLMAEAGEDHVFQLVDLVLDALVDTRVGVAEYVDPPGTDGVEVALAFEVFQPYAFTAFDGHQRQLLVVFHLGAGMPQHREVALHPLVVRPSVISSKRSAACAGETIAQAYAMVAWLTSHCGEIRGKCRTVCHVSWE